MKFIIATPSYNNLSDLRRCVGSVRAQARFGKAEKLKTEILKTHESVSGHISELSVQHIVQDGGSENWRSFQEKLNRRRQGYAGQEPESEEPHLPTSSYQLLLHSEADEGMYDAINKAWDRGVGDVYSWLNCDEQYLPGTLARVAEYFEAHPEADAVFGNAIIVDGEGNPLAARREIPLRKAYVTNGFLYALSCTIFYRAQLRESGLLRLDPSYRYSADADLVLKLLDAGVRFGHIDDYLSLFGVGGGNLSFSGKMAEESDVIKFRYGRIKTPLLRKMVMGGRYAERLLQGCYRKEDVSFDFAVNEVPEVERREAKRLGTRFEYNWYRAGEGLRPEA